jgi:hypothetical protein
MPTKTTKPDNTTARATELADLVAQAQAGDATVLPALRKLLRERPEIWRQVGELSRRAEAAPLDLAGPDQVLVKEAIKLKLAELRDELGAPAAPALERLLIDRVVLTWLQVHLVDLALVEVQRRGQQATLAGKEALKRLDGAHGRLLSSVKTLAVVRKLLKPAVSPLDLLGKPVAEETPVGGRLGKRRGGAVTCN